MSFKTYLAEIERLGENSKYEAYYLWPRTPLTSDHQEIIAKRVSASDFETEDPRSRPYLIVKKIKELIAAGLMQESFSILDLACGDAVVLMQIQKTFPKSQCFGVDCNKDRFGTHQMVREAGVSLFGGYIQQIFESKPDTPFDIVMMLNTYRGWESADLRPHEKDLPRQADEWMGGNARFAVVTATVTQVDKLWDKGFKVEILGKGEDSSKMILATKSAGFHAIRQAVKEDRPPFLKRLRRKLTAFTKSTSRPG